MSRIGLLLTAWACALATLSCGDSGGGSDVPVVPPTPPAIATLTLVAGTLDEGGYGSADGQGAAARFSAGGLTLGADGHVYVADTYNGTVRKVTAAGVVSTAWGKLGEQTRVDGASSAARFDHPRQIVNAPDGSLYVLESPAALGSPMSLRHIQPDGSVRTLLSFEGPVQFNSAGDPGPTAIDTSGNLYFAEIGSCELRRIPLSRPVLERVASFPVVGGTCTLGPYVRSDGNGAVLYVEGDGAMDPNPRHIKRLSASGVVTKVFTSPGRMSSFVVRRDGTIVFESSGIVYVVAQGAETPVRLSGSTQTANIQISADGDAQTALFSGVSGMAADADNNVLMLENQTVRRLDPTGRVTTIAGLAPQTTVYRTGTGSQARIGYEPGLASDSSGNAYLSGAVLEFRAIARITPEGVVSTLGNVSERGRQDGSPSVARFEVIRSLSRGPQGALFVADIRNSVSCGRYGVITSTALRKIDSGGSVSTLNYAFDGDIERLAPLGSTRLLVSGGRYVPVCGSTIKRVTVTADGAETPADTLPAGPAVADGAGNIYVIVFGAVRKRFLDGQVQTLAGSETEYGDRDGIGPAARFTAPSALDIDAAGNLYVADTGNSTIRKITPDGTVSTLVGRAGQHGIRLGELPGGLDRPSGVAVVPQGLLIRSRLALLRVPL